jgi:hypothetical protein
VNEDAANELIAEAQKKAFLKAFEETWGSVYKASKLAGLSTHKYYMWMRCDPNFVLAIEYILEQQVDNVEQHLFECVKKLDTPAIIFYLKNKGKRLGYGVEQDKKTEEAIIKQSAVITDVITKLLKNESDDASIQDTPQLPAKL